MLGRGGFRNKSEKGETLEDVVRIQETTLASHSPFCLEVDLGAPPTASGGFLNPSQWQMLSALGTPHLINPHGSLSAHEEEEPSRLPGITQHRVARQI